MGGRIWERESWVTFLAQPSAHFVVSGKPSGCLSVKQVKYFRCYSQMLNEGLHYYCNKLLQNTIFEVMTPFMSQNPICAFGANLYLWSHLPSIFSHCVTVSHLLLSQAASRGQILSSQLLPAHCVCSGINQLSFHPGQSGNHYSSPASQAMRVQPTGDFFRRYHSHWRPFKSSFQIEYELWCFGLYTKFTSQQLENPFGPCAPYNGISKKWRHIPQGE